MRILFISPFPIWPINTGGRQRRYALASGFSERHEVTVVTPRGEERSDEEFVEGKRRFEIVETGRLYKEDIMWGTLRTRIKNLVWSILPGSALGWRWDKGLQRLEAMAKSNEFDLVWAGHASVAEMAHIAGFRHIVVDVDTLDTISTLRGLRHSAWFASKPLHYLDLIKLYRYELGLAKRFSAVVICKEEDRGFFGRMKDRVFVVPNGVREFPACDTEKEKPDELLFVGSLGYDPNSDAARYFMTSILPALRLLHAGARLRIAGRGPADEVRHLDDGKTCTIHADVEDLAPFYEAAAVVVAPIRLGGGTRLKVLEALAYGKAIVATSTAIEGIDLRPGVDLYVADNPSAFASACASLLDDPRKRAELGKAGRERIMKKYNWDAIVRSAERLFN